jgi:DNA invertase Pin-like site-specific DNA recombinase
MNIVIYCRVSSKEQVEGTSLESQERACREYAARNHLNVAHVFVECGESAKYADRTKLLEMMAYCSKREHHIEQLLVWKVDRLARNVGDHFNIKAGLLKYGVRVVSVTEPIDAKPEGRLLETILAGFAQFDNDVRATRTVQGMRSKIREGIFPWRPPLGYKSVTRADSKKTDPDQPDQPTFNILQQGWIEFSTGAYTKAQILRLLTRRGLCTRSGVPLAKQSIDHIFCDSFYAGIICDPWNGEEHVGRHVPMVSRETFRAVQRIISGRNHSVPHLALRPEFPLRGFVHCGNCESVLTGSFSRGRSKFYPYYHCYSHNCDNQGNYPLADVHREFAQFLDEVSPNRHSLGHLKDAVCKIYASWAGTRDLVQEKRGKETMHLQEQLQRLVQMRMNDLITDDEFRAQRIALAKQLERLEGCASTEEPELDSVLACLDVINAPLMHLADTWQAVPIKIQRRFQQCLIPSGYVFGRIGTAQKGRLLSFLESPRTEETNVGSLEGLIWNQLAEEVMTLAMIFRESSIR